MSVSVIVLLGAPALVFAGAAILADLRRERKLAPDLGVLVLSAIANLVLIFAFIMIGR